MWPFTCRVCIEKDRLVAQLSQDLLVARGQLDSEKERANSATNALLEWKQRPLISTPAKMKAANADAGHAAAFGFFKDEKDDGKGNILEADQFPEGEPIH